MKLQEIAERNRSREKEIEKFTETRRGEMEGGLLQTVTKVEDEHRPEIDI